MRINKTADGGKLDKLERNSSQGTNTKNTTSSTGGAQNKEDVQISNLSTRLQALENSLSSSEVFDTKRVNDITMAIRNGDFKVDSGVVADKLLSSVQELLA